MAAPVKMDKAKTSNERTAALTFVLPVALSEPGVAIDQGKPWREMPDTGALVRTRLFLRTFLRTFDLDRLAEFLLVCPDVEADELKRLLASVTSDSRLKVVPESIVCPDASLVIDRISGCSVGWYVQQLIKLTISEVVQTEYYLTLDSDLICVRPFSYGNLFCGKKALVNVETLSDYETLYKRDFAVREFRAKAVRFSKSARILKAPRNRADRSHFYGETPVIMHTESVREMMSHIASSYGQPAAKFLARDLCWTEYSLYFQYLEMRDQFAALYQTCGPNQILDLERSVWAPSECYLEKRKYDLDYFAGAVDDDSRGLFMAIQSWLPASMWLPPSFLSVDDFYIELEKRLCE